MQKGLGFLATVGSTAPFVGLFGTVWGMMNALVAIGMAGQASIDKVAGPVGDALIMTALGLFVAVPAVMGYNWLLGRNKVLQDAVRNFAGDLHAYLVSGSRVTWPGGCGWVGRVRRRQLPPPRSASERRVEITRAAGPAPRIARSRLLSRSVARWR